MCRVRGGECGILRGVGGTLDLSLGLSFLVLGRVGVGFEDRAAFGL